MPVRELGSRCGALVIDSMPPATTTFAEPALIRSWPSITAFMPEPHTLLMVVQPARGRNARADRGLARGRLAEAGRQHAAHDHFVDLVGRDARVLERALDRGRAEGGGGNAGELAEQGADGGALGTDDDDVGHGDSRRSGRQVAGTVRF